jgi:lipoyl synthase
MQEPVGNIAPGPKPEFLKTETRRTPEAVRVRALLRKQDLHTVCEQARCPNLGNCFAKKVSTFMVLGKTCTRDCAFCAVSTGAPGPVDPMEPEHLAHTAGELGLKHVVITSVTRDDLPDGGAEQFCKCVSAVKRRLPSATVEVLTPDFLGDLDCVARVLDSGPEVFNHNLETVSSLYSRVRPGADYRRSLRIIEFAAQTAPGIAAKSGIMVGMGESREEISGLMKDLADAGCRILTVGQYLAPSRSHWPVAKYYEPREYEDLKIAGLELGFDFVFAGPLVRSSYSAYEVFERFKEVRS